MTRENMIRMLVDSSLAAAAEDPQASWLQEIFRNGFRGFTTLSSADLLRELHFRGLAKFDDAFEDEVAEIPLENLAGLDRSRSSAYAVLD